MLWRARRGRTCRGIAARGENLEPGHIACGQEDQALGCLWLGAAWSSYLYAHKHEISHNGLQE